MASRTKTNFPPNINASIRILAASGRSPKERAECRYRRKTLRSESINEEGEGLSPRLIELQHKRWSVRRIRMIA